MIYLFDSFKLNRNYILYEIKKMNVIQLSIYLLTQTRDAQFLFQM